MMKEPRAQVTFFFNGRPVAGRTGESVAAALLRSGHRLVGRSFKFHRPRGVMGYAEEEPNALLEVVRGGVREPNLRATLVPVSEGLQVYSQNHYPTLRFDVAELLGVLRRFMPASFYYKTFKWPSWDVWEPWVRRIAGLGRAPEAAGSWRYSQRYLECDVLVVGAGRSGIRAVQDALAQMPDARILLVERRDVSGEPSTGSSELAALCDSDAVQVLDDTLVVARYDQHCVLALQQHSDAHSHQPRETLWRIRCSRLVLANGALERPMVFPGNDRPGIMLASALVAYAVEHGVPFQGGVAFYGNNDSLWRSALALAAAGIPPRAIVDVRENVSPALVREAQQAGIDIFLGAQLAGARGWPTLRAVCLADNAAAATGARVRSAHIRCRWLAVSGGWTPTVQLYSQQGAALHYSEELASVVPALTDGQDDLSVVGRAAGRFELSLATQAHWGDPAADAQPQWVDHQYDVTVSDIQLAHREAYRSVEHVKRYTTNGMSLDQGKTSNMNGLGVLAQAAGQPPGVVGTTRYRPPYHPLSFGVIAGNDTGDLYHPRRLLPSHALHDSLGARFEDYGDWWRPAFYPSVGETESEALARETRSVRTAAGILDYSSLGKIEVTGPDACEFLNRMVMNNVATLSPGRARYCLTLKEDGTVLDDGILVCRDTQRYLLHTTSAGSEAVYRHLDEWLQCEWPQLDVVLTNVTGDWGTFMLAGPNAPSLLADTLADIALDPGSFPHMSWRESAWQSQPLRLMRASFTGEPGFELSVPSPAAPRLFETLLQAGSASGLTPFGVESLMLLRMEKGFIHLGADTDGTTMPQDLGWRAAVEKKQSDFVGRRSVLQQLQSSGPRFEFTGLQPLGTGAIAAGAHVLEADGAHAGFVTSAGYSHALGKPVALGLVSNATQRTGETVTLFDNGQRSLARVCPPCFLDPEGERLRG